jgi:hypothetical protein
VSDADDVREIATAMSGVVEVESEKQALLRGEPEIVFTAPGYDHVPPAMIRLEKVDRGRPAELITDAWHMRLA